MYIAHDLFQDGEQRLLSQEVLEMIGNLPKSNTNPYKQKMQSYFDDYDDEPKQEAADP